jgi:TPR repeat protein
MRSPRSDADAADSGYARACLDRAAHLARGESPDWTEVAHWYARAAAAGNAEAAARLRAMTRKAPRSPRFSTLLVAKERP